MSEQHPGSADPSTEPDDDPRVTVVGPDGFATGGGAHAGETSEEDERHLSDLVEQPAKVMRIGSMIRQLLDEVKSAPLDEASRSRLAGIYQASITELETGLAPELVQELERLSLPFTTETPTEAELRIAQAQLVGWLEGLFHGIQTAIYAQQMAARAQLEQIRRALPPGMIPSDEAIQAAQQQQANQPGQPGQPDEHGNRGGMYL